MTTAILLIAMAAEAIGLPTTHAAAPWPAAPAPTGRAHSVPAAGHTSSGSGVRTIRAHHQLRGKASWHATGRDGLYAAACKPLRDAMGKGWRGRRVLVAYGKRAVEVTLNDWCASRTKTIDLSDEAFDYLGRLSQGVLRVEVGW